MKLLYCMFTCSLNLKMQCVLPCTVVWYMFCHKFIYLSNKIIMDVESLGYKRINQIFNALSSTLCVCVCALVCVHACMYVCVCACVQTYFSSLLGQTCTTSTFLLVGLLFLLFLYVEHFWSLRCFFLCVESFFFPLSLLSVFLSLSHTHTHTHTHVWHTH